MKHLLIIISVFFSAYTIAQGELSLQIVNEEDNAIEFANFRLFNVQDSAVHTGDYSNAEGIIKITKIPDGNYYGIVTFFGYKDHTTKELIFSKNNTKIQLGKIYLEAVKSQEFDAVDIVGEEKYMETSIGKRTYNVEQDMTTMGGAATDVLNNIPSIQVDQDGNVSLRGNQNVKILINGRESTITRGDDPLAGISGSAIERVEVVTNPSAKYSPDGTAGIINIVLKKKKLRGFNTKMQATIGSLDHYSGNIGINYRNEYFNIYGNYSVEYENDFDNSFSRRHTYLNDTTVFLNQKGVESEKEWSHTANIGADFFLTDNQVLGIGISGRYSTETNARLQLNERDYNAVLYQYWNREGNGSRDRKSIDFNVNYKLDFKDKKGNLMLSASESIGDRSSTGNYEEFYYWADGTPLSSNSYRFHNQMRNSLNSRFTFNADLERTVSDKIDYGAGLEVKINRLQDADYLAFLDTTNNVEYSNFDSANELNYFEDIYAAYGLFKHKITEKFRYQVGIRLEEAMVDPKFKNSDSSLAFDYFSFFPSAHLAYGNNEMGTFRASYSRRINRPRSWYLNPFPRYNDPMNLRKGNPSLRPEYINSYEAGYEKLWTNVTLTSTLYFREITNKVQRIKYFQADGVGVTTFENIDESYEYGVELIGTYNPFTWWRNMISVNAYGSYLSSYFNGTLLSNEGFTWGAKLSMVFSLLNRTTNIQINGGYNAPRYTLQGVYKFSPGIDVGVTRALLDNKLVIGFRVSDILNQRSFYVELNEGNVQNESQFKWTSRRFFLTLSYKFGDLKATDSDGKQLMRGGDGGGMEMGM